LEVEAVDPTILAFSGEREIDKSIVSTPLPSSAQQAARRSRPTGSLGAAFHSSGDPDAASEK
jgi:hypothetical protein